MLIEYPAIFHREDGALWAEFPDLEGCQTYGEEDKAAECAKEALCGYILTLLDSGRPLPAPSALENISAPQDGFAALVSCDIASADKPADK